MHDRVVTAQSGSTRFILRPNHILQWTAGLSCQYPDWKIRQGLWDMKIRTECQDGRTTTKHNERHSYCHVRL